MTVTIWFFYNLYSVPSWRPTVPHSSDWICMTPIPVLKSLHHSSKRRKKREKKKREKRRMEADFSLWQGQMGCNGMGIWCESRRGLQNLLFFPGPDLTQRAETTSLPEPLSLSLSLVCMSFHLTIAAFAFSKSPLSPHRCVLSVRALRVITLVDTGRCSRMRFSKWKPGPDKKKGCVSAVTEIQATVCVAVCMIMSSWSQN